MDEETFSNAIRQHQDLLYRVAYTLLRNSEDCADALQESLTRAWRSLDSLREPAAFRGWITRIVVNCCKDMLRRRKPHTVELTEEIPAPPVSDAPLAEALASLEEDLRLPITLYYMEGMSVDEIARVMYIAQGTVKNRLFRGRKKLAAFLGEKEESQWS